MKIFDTHTHLNVEEFAGREAEELQLAKEMSVVAHNIVGFDRPTIERALELADSYDQLYATIGWHPTEAGTYDEAVEAYLLDKLRHPKVVALGEIGLDYHWMTRPKEEQQEIFRRQMKVAERVGKPVVIHSRDAIEDTVKILKEFPSVKGIFHCYPGSVETALQVIDNYYFGIGGVLTFKNAKKLVEVVKNIPLEKLILETDCPYMAPTPFRGKRNEPVYVEYVAKKIAEIKGITYDEVAEATNLNTRKAYNMA